MPVVVAFEGELDERLAITSTEPAIKPSLDHDHSEAADHLVVEADECRLHGVERFGVPELGLGDAPGAT
jgi:hypothetical protein